MADKPNVNPSGYVENTAWRLWDAVWSSFSSSIRNEILCVWRCRCLCQVGPRLILFSSSQLHCTHELHCITPESGVRAPAHKCLWISNTSITWCNATWGEEWQCASSLAPPHTQTSGSAQLASASLCLSPCPCACLSRCPVSDACVFFPALEGKSAQSTGVDHPSSTHPLQSPKVTAHVQWQCRMTTRSWESVHVCGCGCVCVCAGLIMCECVRLWEERECWGLNIAVHPQ